MPPKVKPRAKKVPSRSGAKPASAAKRKAAAGSSAKAKRGATGKAAGAKPRGANASVPALLSGGNPQIPKGEGDAPVQSYIAAMPGWKRDVGKRLDALIVKHVPHVKKAVKWNSPFYGVEEQGWFLSYHVFTRYVKVTFFAGASLRPVPPGGTAKSKDARWVDVHEGELDEEQMRAWVEQAAGREGWRV